MINNSFIKKNKEKLMHENSREWERKGQKINGWIVEVFFNKDLCSLKYYFVSADFHLSFSDWMHESLYGVEAIVIKWNIISAL